MESGKPVLETEYRSKDEFYQSLTNFVDHVSELEQPLLRTYAGKSELSKLRRLESQEYTFRDCKVFLEAGEQNVDLGFNYRYRPSGEVLDAQENFIFEVGPRVTLVAFQELWYR